MMTDCGGRGGRRSPDTADGSFLITVKSFGEGKLLEKYFKSYTNHLLLCLKGKQLHHRVLMTKVFLRSGSIASSQSALPSPMPTSVQAVLSTKKELLPQDFDVQHGFQDLQSAALNNFLSQ